jgi:hypothetical protein
VADYDVGVTGLSVPPASAVVQQYRPAVSVRNNGVHSALATGYIRIYSAGQLIETFEVFSGSIPPGESRDAQTVEYWTPPATGRYLFNGYVTCDKDQVEPNNNLPPTYINVTAAPPPPTPPVTIHAAQHEEGGADEVNIDGLQGKTADLQDPTTHGNDAHAATYIVAADAEATVSRHDLDPAAHAANVGLERTSHRGTAGGYAPLGSDAKVPLANLPPISSGPHATTHENGGTDEISVAGLSGKLADAQDPTAHAASHGLTGGDPILSAEYTSRKGTAGGYAGLDGQSKVPAINLGGSNAPTGAFLAEDRTWKVPTAIAPAAHHGTHENDGTDEISVAGLSGKLADAQTAIVHHGTHEFGGTDPISLPNKPECRAQNGLDAYLYYSDPETTIGTLTAPATDLASSKFIADIRIAGALHITNTPLQHLVLNLYCGLTKLSSVTADLPVNLEYYYNIDAQVYTTPDGRIQSTMRLTAQSTAPTPASQIRFANQALPAANPASESIIRVTAQWTNAANGTTLTRTGFAAQSAAL